ncbi:hypothetical protein [Nocardioides alkalitolerans]|uniref:hypothetical protein n=1 Tax=Nocardioides alkalitolerans TaxID=281714 RepID=UPI0004073539|nr:hypothetical protein [Nocardioides alkalitolerans]
MHEIDSSQPRPSYSETYFSLRAPRVAIVFPASTPHWDYFARRALWQANQLWGGAGFVLVPHLDGVVSDHVLRAVAAYDPDYVVPHQVDWRELFTADRSARAMFGDPDGESFDAAVLDDWPATADAHDRRTNAARDHVSLTCQVYRRLDETVPPPAQDREALVRWDQAWSNHEESVMSLDTTVALSPVAGVGEVPGLCVAAPPGLRGPWGSWTAALLGSVDEPELPSPDETDGPNPAPDALSPTEALAMAEWFYSLHVRQAFGTNRRPPAHLIHHDGGLKLGADTKTLPQAWDRSTPGLVSVGDASARRRTTIVVGDTPDDFALALIYERLYGKALWIHSDWSPLAPNLTEAGRHGATALSLLGDQLLRLGHAVITTASADKQLLDGIADLILGEETAANDGEGESHSEVPNEASTERRTKLIARRRLLTDTSPQFPARGMLHLAVIDEYSTRMTLPVLEDDQATTFTTTPPPLRPTNTQLDGVDVIWQVDLRIEGSTMPLGRGLHGEQLAAHADAKYETWIRSGNRSVSYESRRYDFIAAGATLEQRLARPRTRSLNLQAWCDAMAGQAGYDTGWSDAGRRAHLLEQMWGSRQAMSADFAHNFTALAKAFVPTGKSTRTAYPEGDGVFITGVGGFLPFSTIRDILVPRTNDDESENDRAARERETRIELDIHLARGVIRRGLMLQCRTCETLSFVPVDDLGQRNRCGRCGSYSELTLQTWRQPANEPTWFYDLHQVARDLIKNNGHAPAWLTAHLSRKPKNYTDCAELNLYQLGTRQSVAEVDLVALVDGTLITAEVKTSDSLEGTAPRRAQAAHKRLQWAAVLQADEIVLASTAAAWESSSITVMRTKMRDAINDRVFAPDRTPRLRLINNLGSDAVTDKYVDL